jgi:hypothetical protein
MSTLAIRCAVVLLIAGAAGTAGAHRPGPDDVRAHILAARRQFGITAVERHADLPRLLVIRVGPEWGGAPIAIRLQAAEDWLSRWRHATPQGVVAIVDAASDRPLVNFDANGRATIKDGGTDAAGGAPP